MGDRHSHKAREGYTTWRKSTFYSASTHPFDAAEASAAEAQPEQAAAELVLLEGGAHLRDGQGAAAHV